MTSSRVARWRLAYRAASTAGLVLALVGGDACGLHAYPGSLGSGGQKTVEIAKALIQESKVIILDEPTASFSQTEIEHLLDIVRTLAQNGISIIYISHHLEEVFKIADRVTVIRDGRQINTYAAKGLTEQMLIRDMVGRDVSLFYHREPVPVGKVLFEARNLSGNGVKQASLSVRSGEIVGIAGMVGSGRYANVVQESLVTVGWVEYQYRGPSWYR